MAFFKWFAKIEAMQAADLLQPPGPLEPFDYASLKPKTFGGKAKAAIAGLVFQRVVPPLLRLCQRVWPVPYFKWLNLAIVTRDVDVRQVLHDGATFGVPYGPEMTDLGDGTTFALGLDGASHQRQNRIICDIMKSPEDVYQKDIERVVLHTRSVAEALLENGAGRIDAITDYITRIATETAGRYFGINIDDPVAFGEWTLAMSCMLFGDPVGDAATRRLGLNAGTRLRLTLDDSIKRVRSNFDAHPHTKGRDKTVLDRLVALQIAREADPNADQITNEEIRAILLGMITGFVPTNTLAAAKKLKELLSRPTILEKAIAHAKAEKPDVKDREAVKAIILEAARFDSALAPGQWRVARRDAVVAPDTRHSRRIPGGTVVLVSTMTALRDPERFDAPGEFRTDRPVWGDLMFGGGPHHCLGSEMAVEQITEMFMVLLKKDGLRPAPGREGRVEFTGAFPVRLDLLYNDPAATQSMFLIVAPVRQGITKYALDRELATLGHGDNISDEAKAAFDATGIVHFASISTILSERGLDLIIELSVDGTIDTAIDTLAQKAWPVLQDVLQNSDLKLGEDPDKLCDDLAPCMRRHLVTLHSKPWGATGLDYFGTGEFSVQAIERQEKFAKLSEKILASFLDPEARKGAQPMRALNYVRRILNHDRYHAFTISGGLKQAMEEASQDGLDTFPIKPSRSKLKLADFTNATYSGAFRAFLVAREGRIVVWPVLALLLGFAYSLYRIVAPPALIYVGKFDWRDPFAWLRSGVQFEWSQFDRVAWGWAAISGGAVLAAVLALAGFVSMIALWLRFKELRDLPDQRQASPERIEELGRNEDHPGFAHNHFMAVGDFKPGLLRTLIHAVALWGIKMVIIFYYRPGFVVNMGTIHYARWWRLPGTGKSVFFSNYDGSWDSYLEDFITRARWGQTAAWSNWQGFPKTRLLIFEGAKDGDRFKRWVRTKQQVVPFWYSRFRHLTTDQIRNNALIHHGLARIRTDSEAREWLRCFGSMPRMENLIETDEVQSLVFRGFRDLTHSSCLICRLPPVASGRMGYWLRNLQGKIAFGDHQIVGEENPMVPAMPAGVLAMPASRSPDRGIDLVTGSATFFALSAAGFHKFRSPDRARYELLDMFPPAFTLGMAKRSRILGDFGDAAPENWGWSDTPGAGAAAAEAVLMVYAKSEEALKAAVEQHKKLLEKHDGAVLRQTDCAPPWQSDPELAGREHFGYRDGISQPVIRGTERFTKGVPARDILEPGEFILGYKSNQGYFPPSPLVPAETDIAGNLPMPSSRELSRFPDFGLEQSGASPRDFGRNGSFVVIRELEQDVERFNDFVARKAREITGKLASRDPDQIAYTRLPDLIGQQPDAEWIKAKLMGRWPNGRPLIGNPVPDDGSYIEDNVGKVPKSVHDAAVHRAQLDNDFSYGIDDPQGFACPFGAHIRRTNPRDSKQPGDPNEQVITNRHRLLRRGRSYDRGGKDKGLLFVALCADLERQFEFVQQTWANSPSFHGLTDEPDPIIGSGLGIAKGPASFTIPTPAGPIKLVGVERFVTTRAGGYFFMPSRSALTFLKELAFRSSRGT